MDTAGRTALVTGGAKRVGKAIALSLAEAGCNIVLHYYESHPEAESVATLVRDRGRDCLLTQANLEDPASIATMLNSIDNNGIEVDVLINSASLYYETHLEQITVRQWDENLNVNLRAPFLLAQSLGRRMTERGSGKIINIADSSVKRLYKNYLPYLVSKVAMVGLTEILALELAPAVQVNTIAPGTVLLPQDTPNSIREQTARRAPLQRIGSPDDVASMVLHLVRHGDFLTGGYYAVDGGSGIR